MSTYDLKNLNKRQNVAPGIAAYALVAKRSDFTTLQGIAVPTDDTPTGDRVKIKTPHVFKDGKAWSKWSLAKDKNQMEATGEGDPTFRQLKQTATLFIPGSDADMHSVMADLLNEDLIVLVRDSTCASNLYYQLGNDCSPAAMNPKFTTSTTASGVKGYEVTIEYSGPCVQLYDAAIGSIIEDGAGENIVMTFVSEVEATNSGVVAEAEATNANIQLRFQKAPVLSVGSGTMFIEVAGVLQLTLNYNLAYVGKPFTFYDTTGAGHPGSFVLGATVNFE